MDTSTILWIVIIVGAMIYNAASQNRKRRSNAENQSPQHGEAWPSIPWDDMTEPQKPSPADPAPASRQATAQQPHPEPRTTSPEVSSDRVRPENGTLQTPTSPAPCVSEDFPDECQSLEEIRPEEYIPEIDTLKPDIRAYSSPTELRPTELKPHAGKGRQGGPCPKAAASQSQAPEESIAELVEEFDLRRAVIYSEILKPKFED